MILSPQILQVGGEQVSIRSDDHLHALSLNRHTVDASATQSLLVNLLAVSDLAAQASHARLDRHHVVDSPQRRQDVFNTLYRAPPRGGYRVLRGPEIGTHSL